MKKVIRPSGVSIAIQKSKVAQTKNISYQKKITHGYTIKLANTLEERQEAYCLVYKVYLEKGFIKENGNQWHVKNYDANPETAILIVKNKNKTGIVLYSLFFKTGSRKFSSRILKKQFKPRSEG